MEMDEFASAAEVLKGGLRKGLATDDWAHESLAHRPADEPGQPGRDRAGRPLRASTSTRPTPKAYLKAAKVEAELKNHDQAIAFCKRAAEFAPGPADRLRQRPGLRRARDRREDRRRRLGREQPAPPRLERRRRHRLPRADQGAPGEAHQAKFEAAGQNADDLTQGARRADHARPRDRTAAGRARPTSTWSWPSRAAPSARRPRSGPPAAASSSATSSNRDERPAPRSTPPRWPSRAPTRSP